MFTRKPRLQLEKFAINGAKRLLQHNRHLADLPTDVFEVRLQGRSGHSARVKACTIMSA